MTFLLALKNTRLYFRKRLPLALFLAATLALLFLGNTVFSGTDAGLQRTFQTSLTADLSISSASEDPFTLFGSELPLLGEFFKMPLILDYDQVVDATRKALPTASLQPVVVGAAKLSLDGFSSPCPLFGADIGSYLSFFPSLKVVLGAAPELGKPALFLNAKLYAKATQALGHAPPLGSKFLLTAPQDDSFAIREVPLAGVYDYPAYDPLLENAALIDVGTSRALAGYFITQATGQGAEATVTADSVDDLFAGAKDTKASEAEGISFEAVTQSMAGDTKGPVEDPKTWNFVLIRVAHPAESGVLLEAALKNAAAPLQIRDWRGTAGGNAKIVWFIQLLFNLGLIFISLVAGLVVMNSMSLAVAERTKEIGTMRSLGAGRGWVARLISWETVVLVTGAGAVGVLFGALVVAGAGWAGGIPIDNQFLATLLGTVRYSPELSIPLMGEHVLLSLVLGALATVIPVNKALKVSPLQAMARD
jgi:putative ABC transport system permease protein